MKKLLTYISLFLIPILVVWILAEVFYRTVPNNYTYKHQQISNNKDIEVLILGDSHTFYGINPEWLSLKAYNLSNVSQTIYFDQLLLEKHINNLNSLKYVVLAVEYTTLSQADNTQEDIWRKYFYASQMDLEVPLVTWYNPKKYSLVFSRKFNYTWNTYKDYKVKGTLIGCDVNGWGNTYSSTVDSVEMKRLARVVAKKHEDGSMNFSLNSERIQQMIDLCKSKNIEILLVNMPSVPEYVSLLNSEKWKKIDSVCKQLEAINTNVTRIDLLNEKQFILEDFQDADHLNAKGAKKCTLTINQYLNK
ncbi:SGNH/GDSL hydrolase family protein [Xanthomarina spongicola]|uniref:GDSL-like lipase/acylhydrolase family protein n=1 Tax=Xanthomarina spongicola TaxID=570520 RepID=A0A316DK21_9FLAO|nr:hypothetical protein [Xanthomarina spongicola]PWK18205.1 hypothetical protein LX78_02114 [Xanthomarina spongicola]